MTYVNKFMANKGLPKDLRAKIRRYLEYNWEYKKMIKIEEEEVMYLLNEDLKSKITVYLNGRHLHFIDLFGEFRLDFISELTFQLQKKKYALDDNIIFEGEQGNDIFFIV